MRDLHSDVVPFRDLPDPTNLWDLQGKIGEGTYGTVYRAKQRDTGQEVAIKVLESVDEILDEVEQEYVILRDLSNHANIPQFYGLFLKPDPKQDQLWITMELCSGGSVTELVKARLQKGHRMDEHVIAHILKETMKGLQHLHEHHVMHRDVKGHNILLTQEGKVKLIDFGVSRKLKNTQDQCCTSLGTPFWMAPEVIACEQQVDTNYDIRCDIWSLGITAIELADGDPPLADLHPMRALFKIPRNPAPSVRKKDDWSRNFLHFIDRCVQKDFEKRPYLSELFCHPFITQVPPNTSKLKTTLQDLLRRTEGAVHEPQATVKHGQLRMRHQMDSISAVNDLATLEALDKGMIVDHLERRYNNSLIYTYIGDILLAVNPFNPLTIYTEQYSRLYRHSAKADHPPHIFAMADQTYQSMVHGRCNQCIVISGESGAGKTESANFLIQQLTQLGRAPNRDLEERILQVNPLMEAFGNAQTVINSNSSRFGKYLEMTFTGSGKVTGARLSEYLLERSRVVNHAKGETNFHVFYYLYDGLVGSEKAARYYLTEKVNYRYLGSNRGHGCVLDVRTATASKNKCKTIQRCFEIIGFRTQEVSAIFSILSAILHIGNIDFLEKEVKHQTTTIIGDTDLIQIVAELLGVDARELRVSLTTSSMVARGEMIVRHNSVTECIDCRDALSKEIYGRLFCWLVNQVNDLLRPSHSNEDSTESLTVGILDIFGFENFERNSFEQLCINIANEQIQYYFNQHVFAWEQQEYKNEGIDATEIKFVDNRPVLDMFLTKPMGLLALLDEESNFPKATDLTLVEKFGQNITSDIFSRPKSQGLVFTVQHYAGKVEYSAAGLLEKNRDRLAHEVMNMLRISQIALVRTIFCCSVTKTGNLASASDSNGGSSSSSFTSTISIRSASNVHSGVTSQARIQQTVATYFRYSLMDLLSKMVAGAPHFVRCIRPNTENSPGYFDPEKVEVQLKYTGVLETTHIRRLGFSHRIPFSEFLRRYAVLGLSLSEHLPANKDTCKQLLEQIGLENWALGNTKVFLKYYHVDLLCQLFEAKQRCIIRAQSVVRMRLQRKHYLQYKDRLYSSVVCIQKVIRGYHVRKQLYLVRQRRTAAAVLMQKMVRGFLQRRSYKIRREVTLHSCIIIQRGLRGWLARMRVRRLRISRQAGQQRAAVVLQCGVRAWQARNLRKTLEGHKAQYTAQTAKFMKQVRMSAAKVFLLTSKHQPRPKPVTKPEPVPNSELFMFWPGQNDTAATGQPNSGVTPQANGCIRSRAMSPVAVHHQSDRVDGHGRGSKVALSDDRLDHIKKAHDIKTPWTEKDAVYYDSISQDSNHEKRLWAEANRDCSKGDTKAGGVWDAPLQVAKEKAINDINQQERELELQRELAEVDEMFRSVLAASVAAKFLGSRATANVAPECGALPVPPSGLHKTMSEHSLAWDAVLEQAKKTALAPGTKALLCEAESALASCHHPATNSYSHCWPYDTESATDSYCISSTDSQFLDNPDSATDSLFYEVPGPWTNETFSTLMMRKPQNRDMNVYNSAMSSLGQCSPDISEFYDTPLTQVLNTKNDYYNLQRWLIPDTQFHIPLTNSPRIARKNSCTKLSIQHHRETRGSPWVCYYPPTPPVHHSDPVYQTILIPAPPTSPAPSPPSNGAGNNNRKRVHFSGTDEIFITQMRNDVARPLNEDSDNADSEDEKMTGVKRKDSAPKLMNGQKGDMEGIVEKKEQQQESHKKRSSSKCDTSHADNNNTSTSQSEHCDDTTALDKCDGEGTVNFRSLLRKTNYDPKSTLRRLNASNDTVNQVDFRDVLKRKSSDVSRDRKTTVQHVS